MTEEMIEAAIGDAHYLLGEAMPDSRKTYEAQIEDLNSCFEADEPQVSEALNGSRRAHEDLCERAERMTAAGQPLPLWLQHYVVRVAAKGKPRAKRGRKVEDYNRARDAAITWATFVIVLRYALKPTRSPGWRTPVESGCSIVAMALKRLGLDPDMTEGNLDRIWRTGAGPALLTLERRLSDSLGPNLLLWEPMEYLPDLQQGGKIAGELDLCHIHELKLSDVPGLVEPPGRGGRRPTSPSPAP
jgi:hypothetical protein